MSGPADEDAEPQGAPVGRARDQDDASRQRNREQNRRYRESHPEQHAANRRRWVEANRDRVREMNRRWRAEHLERARQLNRDSMRRAAARDRRQAEQRARGRERAKRWRDEHPDRVRDYQQHWVEENREKMREYYNRYYRNHRDEVNARAAARRDADPERAKEARKAWAERNKELRAESQRIRRSDPEIYRTQLEANAAARRLRRWLENAGLRPKQLHPATAAERRANDREAAAYFSDPALSEHVRQSTVFTESLTEHMLKNGAQMREFADAYAATRSRMGLPPVPVEDIMYARAVEFVSESQRRTDLLTSRDVAAAVRSVKSTVERHERKQQFERLVKAVVGHVNRNHSRLGVDAEMENLARSQRAMPRLPVESLVVQLALQEVVDRAPTSRLRVADVRRAFHAAKIRVVTPVEGNTIGSGASVSPAMSIRSRDSL